ncbi:hypothetical protein ID866_10621 [Astraeus odoratus]|nr:hypothetical protein ID866_10621 [Astraeus odoratus]
MKDGNCIKGTLHHMFYNGLPDCIKDKGIDACYWECKSEIAHQTKNNPQPSSSSKQFSSGGSSSRQSGNSSGTTSSSSAGKKPQQPSSSSSKPSSDSSMPDLSGVLGKDGKLTAAECLHHIKNALCLFCGLPGHSAKDCPRSTSCVARAHATQAASVAVSTVETPAKVKK